MDQASKTRRVITPEEVAAKDVAFLNRHDLAHTVATEPERIAEAERRGAVKALRDVADVMNYSAEREQIVARADAIENGIHL